MGTFCIPQRRWKRRKAKRIEGEKEEEEEEERRKNNIIKNQLQDEKRGEGRGSR